MARIRKGIRLNDDVVAIGGPHVGLSGQVQRFQMIDKTIYAVVFIEVGNIVKIKRDDLALKENMLQGELTLLVAVASETQVKKQEYEGRREKARLTKAMNDMQEAANIVYRLFLKNEAVTIVHDYTGWISHQIYPFGLLNESHARPSFSIDVEPLSKIDGVTQVTVNFFGRKLDPYEAKRLGDALIDAGNKARELRDTLNPWLELKYEA